VASPPYHVTRVGADTAALAVAADPVGHLAVAVDPADYPTTTSPPPSLACPYTSWTRG